MSQATYAVASTVPDHRRLEQVGRDPCEQTDQFGLEQFVPLLSSLAQRRARLVSITTR